MNERFRMYNRWRGGHQVEITYKVLQLFCGIGGGSLGFANAQEEYRGIKGRFENICGIDVDPEACEDYRNLTGNRAEQLDLFDREQYIQFHGQQPPEDWQEVTPEKLRIMVGEIPDVVFTSPPCKGFSGLLPEKSAKTKKYQALNRLTIRSIRLILEAYQDNLPALILVENVPRITTRGKHLLDEIKQQLRFFGYEINDEKDNFHDCGEIGGLAQKRKRFLLIARNPQKLDSFVYQPPKQQLKAIGEVIGPLPMPGDGPFGKIHQLPNLQWKTWVRLALIPPGGDWRDLENCEWEKYRITHLPRSGCAKVAEWDKPSGTITGAPGVGRSNSTTAVADPRTGFKNSTHQAIYKVQKWDETANTVTGAMRPNNGAMSISDPRLPERDGRHAAVYQIIKFDEPGPCVTGTRFGSGATAISDPRLQQQKGRYTNKWQILEWEKQATTVTGTQDIQAGAQSIADPRLSCNPRSGTMGVQRWDEPAKTVIGSGDVHAGATAVADPRTPDDKESGVFIILAEDGTWHRPMTTFENAMIQGLPMTLANGEPLKLSGNSDARWRERIGNMVPPAAAQAIGETMLRTMLAQEKNDWLMSAEEIWVVPLNDLEHVNLTQ